MTYRDIEELQMLLDKDIRAVIAKNDISPKDYQCLDIAVDIEKDLYEIAKMIPLMEEANQDDWYSGDDGSSYDSVYGNRRRRSFDDAQSNNRGNASGDMHQVEQKLHNMMSNAKSEQERQVISKLMKEMENM